MKTTAVAKAVGNSVVDGAIPLDTIEDLMIIMNVFVHSGTLDRERGYLNNYKSMRHAIKKALEGRFDLNELKEKQGTFKVSLEIFAVRRKES